MEYSSHYSSEEQYRDWCDRQHKLTHKYESKMVEAMGVKGDSVAEALVDYLPEDLSNQLLEGVGLAVFVYDQEEVLNHGEVVYKDQNLTITKQFYAPPEDPTDNLIRDLLNDIFETEDVASPELTSRSGETVVDVLPPEKEKEPKIEGTIYNVWVRVDLEEADK